MELLTAALPLASARQRPAVVESFLTPPALPRWASASFWALVFPLRVELFWFYQFLWLFVTLPSRGISSWPIWVSVWACGAALTLLKRRVRASRAAQALALSLRLHQIFSPASFCEDPGIPVRLAIRYCHWSAFLLLPSLWGSASAIFFPSEKGLFSFATLRLLILHGESRLVLLPGLQNLDVFFPIWLLMFLLPGLEIFLVLGTAKHASRFARIHRVGFFLRR